VSLEEDEDSGDGRQEQFKSRMTRMIEKQKAMVQGYRAQHGLAKMVR
jgi:hypothetical protein